MSDLREALAKWIFDSRADQRTRTVTWENCIDQRWYLAEADKVLGVVHEHALLVPKYVPEPCLMEAVRGTWMAVSPDGYQFHIGVEEATSEAARTHWFESQKKWEKLAAAALGGSEKT